MKYCTFIFAKQDNNKELFEEKRKTNTFFNLKQGFFFFQSNTGAPFSSSLGRCACVGMRGVAGTALMEEMPAELGRIKGT